MTEPLARSWTCFWGELLSLRCQRDNPLRWTARETRAAQLAELGVVGPGVRVLDLGCGDGLLDICLARRGAQVLAVDRLNSLLRAARAGPDGRLVTFLTAELLSLELADASFGAVLCLDCVGLLEPAAEQRLWRQVRGWLAPGGVLAVDLRPPLGDDATGSSEQLLDDGRLVLAWSYTAADQMLWIQPQFQPREGPAIVLEDPYRSDGPRRGVWRHLPTVAQLQAQLAAVGFEATPVDLNWREGGGVLVLARPAEER